MSMDGKVTAYSTRTGRAQRVPPHYLTHPVLSADWSDTPTVGTEDQRPAQSWNNPDIRTWATAHGIDLPDDATKAEMLAVIDGTATTTDTGGTAPSDQTPA